MNIENLPELVSGKIISAEDAAKKIAEAIHRFPHRFGLISYDEDFRSEIILTVIQKGSKLFTKFQRGKSSFISYIHFFVQGLIMSQKRDNTRKYISECTVSEYLNSEVEYKQDEIEKIFEKRYAIAQKKKEYTILSNDQVWKNIGAQSVEARKKRVSKTALILALKSSYYIKPDEIDEVAEHCRLEGAEIHRMVSELNSHLYKKIRRRNNLQRSRDIAYFFHRKYNLQLNYFNHKTDDTKNLEKKYNKRTELWNIRNAELRNNRSRITPTNKMIAKILNICERQVCYYITHAKEVIKKEESLRAQNDG